jgi:hypothetical protein
MWLRSSPIPLQMEFAAMGSFLIDSYKTRIEVARTGNPVVTGRTRVIELTSTIQFHGIIERAALFFSTSWDNWSGTPAAGYYDLSSPFQPRLTGWLPSAEFSLWYDLLRPADFSP